MAATLEKNIASITVKKFDMEFDVDPLFHKVGLERYRGCGDGVQLTKVHACWCCHTQMSKAFDEGGARGMLLNHLVSAVHCYRTSSVGSSQMWCGWLGISGRPRRLCHRV